MSPNGLISLPKQMGSTCVMGQVTYPLLTVICGP